MIELVLLIKLFVHVVSAQLSPEESQSPVCQIVSSTTIAKGVCFPAMLCSYFQSNNYVQGDCPVNSCCFITSTVPKPLPSCGKKGNSDSRISPRILGGEFPGENEYCWQVAIIDVITGKFLGGGSLIKESIVLTAAHILIRKSAINLRLRIGDYDLFSDTSCGFSNVTQIIVHPNFNTSDFQNDIALLRLETPVNINSGCACLVCLPNSTNSSNNAAVKSCSVSGFGSNVKDENKFSQYLRVASTHIIEINECITAIQRKRKKFSQHPSFLCSIGEHGKDTCTGDGGGPLVCDNGSGAYIQYGIISWGLGCGDPNMPFISTNVSALLSWILQIADTLPPNIPPVRSISQMFSPGEK